MSVRIGPVYLGLERQPRDLWVGVYWKMVPFSDGTPIDEFGHIETTHHQYYAWVCLVPCLPITVSWTRELPPRVPEPFTDKHHASGDDW